MVISLLFKTIKRSTMIPPDFGVLGRNTEYIKTMVHGLHLSTIVLPSLYHGTIKVPYGFDFFFNMIPC